MTLERSLALVTALLLLAVLGLGGFAVIEGTRRQIEAAKLDEMRSTALLLTSSMAQAASLSATHAATVAGDRRVIELYKAGDRDGLVSALAPLYDALSREAGVNMLHFHTADLKSFLRVQDPGNFGQDLSSFRPMILAANRSRTMQKGLEVGLAGLSLRAVAPILDQGALIGTVEVGVDLAGLLELAKSASGADFALLLSPAISGIAPEGAADKESAAGLVIEAATDTALVKSLAAAQTIRLSNEPIQGMVEEGDRRFGTLAEPLLDYSGRMIGTILITRDFSTIEVGFLRSVASAVIVALVGAIVGFSVVMIAVRALVIRPLGDLADHAEALAAGAPRDAAPRTSTLSDFVRAARAVDALATRAGRRSTRDGGAG